LGIAGNQLACMITLKNSDLDSLLTFEKIYIG
jgi:hypothetical protein